MKILFSLALVSLVAACGSDGAIDSNEAARRAYLGLDGSVGKSIALGFDGFNAANSANIPPQATTGVGNGTLTISGQVDQGSSANKGMRLEIGMVAYSDGDFVIDANGNTSVVTYDTGTDVATQPALDMQLKGIPDGTLDGTLLGTYTMSGDLAGDADLNLTFTGELQAAGSGTIRSPGTTHITGTMTTPDGGSFVVDITL